MLSIDITIENNTQRVNFITDAIPEDRVQSYYVGWTDATTEEFANLTNSQVLQLAEKKNKKEYSGVFGNNSVFFLLYRQNVEPTIIFTSAGVPMQQDIVDENICPHDDVVVDGTTYKVFGVRIYQPDPTDTMTVKY